MWIDEKVHGTGEAQGELDHVEDCLVLVQPHVVVGNGHCLEGHGLGILEERVGAPHILKPLHLQQSVATGHVLGQSQAVVFPRLRKEDVGGVGLLGRKRLQLQPSGEDRRTIVLPLTSHR